MAVELVNVVNVPVPGSPRFQQDTAMAISRIRAALGPEGVPTFGSATFADLTANALVYADADSKLASVTLGSSLTFAAPPTLNTIQGIRTTDSPTFAGLTLTGMTGVVWANAGVLTSNATLDLVGNLAANKTFNNAANSISFNFTNPTNQPTYDGAFEIQASGAFAGDLLHVHQHTGNPGATDLCHFEATDADVTILHLTHSGGAGKCLSIDAGAAETASITAAGAATFSGLTVGALSGVLKATAGVVAGGAAHSELASIGANDHHNQAHAIDGADHTASGLTAGHVLTATSETTFAFQAASGGVTLVADETARLALSATSDNGDVAYQEDTGNLYFYREL